MPQGIIPFQYKEEKSSAGLTALGGLPLYLDLIAAMRLGEIIGRQVRIREGGQGWTAAQFILALMLLNLAGGDCVDDLERLNEDEGFARILEKAQKVGMRRQQRRAFLRRWRKERTRAVLSPTAAFRYLGEFHDVKEEERRVPGKAFIPASNEYLRGLMRVVAEVVAFVQRQAPSRVATLDQDATLVQSYKETALYCYKHYQAYQPLNTYWAEQGLILHSEFRDGNVPSGYQQLRVLQEALALLPAGVLKVYLRSDTAGYQQDLLKYCARGESERFGVIEFAVGTDVTMEFKKAVAEVASADWHPLRKEVNGELRETDQEWAEVCFVPQWAGYSKKDPDYRFLAIREPLKQLELPGTEAKESELPFPTMEFARRGKYKLFGVVTNRTLPGEELIWWHRERCGKSEEAHAVMKEDLAGGQLPCAEFGANAAWWQIMQLAFNVNVAMKRLVLHECWKNKRMKALRFGLIHLAGRVAERAHTLFVRLRQNHPMLPTLLAARKRILELQPAPAG